MWLHPTLLLLAILLLPQLFGLWAESRARRVFQEYASHGLERPLTGALAAAAICRAGRTGVDVVCEGRFLSRRYDPVSGRLQLNPHTFEGRSITSIAKGIFEAGYVLQRFQCYRWFGLRSGVLPINNRATRECLLWCFYSIGLVPFAMELQEPGALRALDSAVLLVMAALCSLMVLVYIAVVAVQLAGLWVAVDASKRAKSTLARADLPITQAERRSLLKVIEVAPLAYAGASLTAFVTVPYRRLMRRPVHGDARGALLFF